MMSPAELASRIEHTLLVPEATPEQIDRLCEEALRYGFAGVCVNPVYVRRVAERVHAGLRQGNNAERMAVVCPVGFPLGATKTETKVDEARRAIEDGADHIDAVASIGALVAGDESAVRRDIEALAYLVHGAADHGVLKVILETAVLTSAQMAFGCRMCIAGGADFVKTSTGFHPRGGATVEHVQLLRHHARPLKVKASGGIRTAATAQDMLSAGADRLGTSAGVAIMDELDRAIS